MVTPSMATFTPEEINMLDSNKYAKMVARKQAFENDPVKKAAVAASIEASNASYNSKKQKSKESWKQYKAGLAFYHENRKNIFFIPSINLVTSFAFLKISDSLYRMVTATRHPNDKENFRMLKSVLGNKLANNEGIVIRVEGNSTELFEKFLTII